MKIQSLLIALLFLASSQVLALDKNDAGVFALVHRDGSVTDKIARLSVTAGQWRIEDRDANGNWQDVTCEEGCTLDVTPADIVTSLIVGTELEGRTLDCVNNKAFAFCGSGKASARIYYMLAFANGKVIPLRWVRVDPATLKATSVP